MGGMERVPRVAIIDDEESIRRALLRIFRQTEIEAEAFESAASFLNTLDDHPPDCIVLDLKMPGITGFGLLRELVQHDSPPPVIVLSALDDARTRDTCEALGSRFVLRKPVDQETLMDCVRRVLRKS
jgi:FixJ family two-component response regulator